jgi:hypothetical protein
VLTSNSGVKSLKGQRRVTVFAHGPTDNGARTEVDEDGQVCPAERGPHVRDIADPCCIRRRPVETAVQKIRRRQMRWIGLRRSAKSLRPASHQVQRPHSSFDALPTHMPPLPAQLAVYTRTTVPPSTLGVDGLHLNVDCRGLPLAGTHSFGSPCVYGASRNGQGTADRGHRRL